MDELLNPPEMPIGDWTVAHLTARPILRRAVKALDDSGVAQALAILEELPPDLARLFTSYRQATYGDPAAVLYAWLGAHLAVAADLGVSILEASE